MRKKFSISWKSSKKPSKQRKYRYNAPLHIKQKFMHTHLSKELRQKYKRRAIGLRKGDKVKILSGRFKKKTGKVERLDLKKVRAYIAGIEIIKKDGAKALYPLHPSNLMIIEMNVDDKMRQRILDRNLKKES